jgi:hypothetical protein
MTKKCPQSIQQLSPRRSWRAVHRYHEIGDHSACENRIHVREPGRAAVSEEVVLATDYRSQRLWSGYSRWPRRGVGSPVVPTKTCLANVWDCPKAVHQGLYQGKVPQGCSQEDYHPAEDPEKSQTGLESAWACSTFHWQHHHTAAGDACHWTAGWQESSPKKEPETECKNADRQTIWPHANFESFQTPPATPRLPGKWNSDRASHRMVPVLRCAIHRNRSWLHD